MKKFFKISGSILTVLLVVFSILCVKSYFESKKPVISEGYYKDFKSSAELESKYSVPGPYEISSYIFDIDLLLECWVGEYIFPIRKLLFCPIDSVLCCREAFFIS